ncbi:MAG: hypothetical protein ACRDAQ_02005 [Cetobacterium sp.]
MIQNLLYSFILIMIVKLITIFAIKKRSSKLLYNYLLNKYKGDQL